MPTTADPFLAMLSPAAMRKPSPQRAPFPLVPLPAGPVPQRPAEPNPEIGQVRPSYADDIDRIVSELVAAGDVVFDAATDSYRAPHYRRFRFGATN